MIPEKNSSSVFWLLEVNLLLWLAVVGTFIPPQDLSDDFALNTTQYVVIAGCVFAAFLQHWAYYKIYKPNKKLKSNVKKI